MGKIFFGIVFLSSSLFIINSCGQKSDSDDSGKSKSAKVLDLDTYMTQLKTEKRPYHFVDVRTPEEVAEGTIEGAINIDFNAADFTEKITALEKGQPIYLFCRSGNRSGKASNILLDAGYSEIYDLKGGYKAYSAAK